MCGPGLADVDVTRRDLLLSMARSARQ